MSTPVHVALDTPSSMAVDGSADHVVGGVLGDVVNGVVGDVVRLCARLEELSVTTGLEPGPSADEAFRRLVQACTYQPGQDAAAVLAGHRVRPLVAALRRLCAEGEQDLNVLNFERFKWGGVRRGHLR